MLTIQNLKKQYSHFQLDCSLDVKPGYITGLIGQNGAGKSTLFKAILGLIQPESGNITVLGKDIQHFTSQDKQKIGVVLADSGFSGYLCLNDIADILAKIYVNFDPAVFIQQCQHFQLPLNKKIKDFSTGMKAKVKILTALSHQAQLLILDEPTSGLDALTRDEILDLLRDYMLQKPDRSILISSHISSDLEHLCDDFYMIHQGHIILHEDTDVLLSDYAILKVNPEHFSKIDHQYLLKVKKEPYGYQCLTNHKQFYLENYPDTVAENGGIDHLIMMMIRGEDL